MPLPALDFPASPTVDQVYPSPPVTGQPTYRWDGTVWLSTDAATDATDVSVAEDQAFTESQKAQGRENIYAAPFDALAYNGMQINGSMEVSQEKGTGQTTVSAQYIVDGLRLWATGTMGLACGQAGGGPSGGLAYIVYASTLTAQPSLGANDETFLFQTIEGWRVARLGWGAANAQPMTIAFWSSHVRTGTYSVSIHNGANNRNYSTTYTHAASNVWQYNVITIPGDTTGTWAKDNTAGMVVEFAIAAGASKIAPSANTWGATIYTAAPGQINGVAATSDSFRITGVVVLPGIEAPSAERSALIMRPYDQELLTCQRYYEKSYPIGVSPGAANQLNAQQYDFGTALTNAGGTVPFSVRKRSAPTVTVYDDVGAANKCSATGGNGQPINIAAALSSDRSFAVTCPVSTPWFRFHWAADIRL